MRFGVGQRHFGANVNVVLVGQASMVILLAHVPSYKDTSELMFSDVWNLMPDWQ